MYNKLYTTDCFEQLKTYPLNCIDLVYLDPPFFTQKNWDDFKDTWKSMSHYINWLSKRLIEMKRVMKPTASIYLHCDYHASHYIKIELDKLFGVDNFRNEIIWRFSKINNINNYFIPNHNTLFFYSKTDKYSFQAQYDTTRLRALYQRFEKYINKSNLLLYGSIKHKQQQLLTHYIAKETKRLGRDLLDDDFVIDFSKPEGRFEKVDDVWYIPLLKGNSTENIGYSTQKPEALLERIISASSNIGDVVLDPMCGSGTACVVAKRLGRRYIGMDVSEKAIDITRDRLNNIQV